LHRDTGYDGCINRRNHSLPQNVNSDLGLETLLVLIKSKLIVKWLVLAEKTFKQFHFDGRLH
jgi:hypothetical protein